MTRHRIVVAAALVLLTTGTVLWAAPSWVEAGRHALAERRWPAERAEIERALAAVALPERYAAVPCDGGAETDRCWRATASPAEVVDDLGAALDAVADGEVATSTTPGGRHGTLGADALGTVAGRVVQLTAWRETDESRLPATPFGPTVLVRLTADLEAP